MGIGQLPIFHVVFRLLTSEKKDDIYDRTFLLQAFGVTVIVWFLVMYLAGTCARLTEFTVVFSGILVTYTVSFGLEVWIIVEGMKGSPLDTIERSRIPWIIYLDTVSHVGQVAFNGACLGMVL